MCGINLYKNMDEFKRLYLLQSIANRDANPLSSQSFRKLLKGSTKG